MFLEHTTVSDTILLSLGHPLSWSCLCLENSHAIDESTPYTGNETLLESTHVKKSLSPPSGSREIRETFVTLSSPCLCPIILFYYPCTMHQIISLRWFIQLWKGSQWCNGNDPIDSIPARPLHGVWKITAKALSISLEIIHVKRNRDHFFLTTGGLVKSIKWALLVRKNNDKIKGSMEENCYHFPK